MNLIKNNPYRTAGLLVGASAKEQDRQVRRLKNFIEADQNPDSDYSFPVLGAMNRTIGSVEDATSKLNLNQDKIHAALFWFWNGNPITDEAAFDALKEGNINEAVQIWTKMIITTKEDGKKSWKPVTQKNLSAFHNFFVLTMLKQNASFNNAVCSQLFFLESDWISNFIAAATDQTYKINKKDLQLYFINKLQEEKSVNQDKLIEIIKANSFSAKDDFFKLLAKKLLDQIEDKIEHSKNKRKNNEKTANKIGLNLYEASIEDCNKLKTYLGSDDHKYITVIDKLSNEILQCSIDYYNHHQKIASDSSHLEQAMSLARLAKSIAIGKVVKDRIQENLAVLEEAKDIEINQAIVLLQSVKDAYDKRKAEITAEVKKKEATLSANTYVDWTKVNEVIEQSIDWNKVVEMIQSTIPPKNIEKIKTHHSSTKVDQYKKLVDFALGKMNNSQINKVAYICYWKTFTKPSISRPSTARTTPSSNSHTSATKAQEFNFVENAWWILAIVGAIIGLFIEPDWPSMLFGAILGGVFSRIFRHPWALVFPGGGALFGLMHSLEAAGMGGAVGLFFAFLALLKAR